MAPLTRRRASDKGAIPADYAVNYYAQRASPGGLIISEGTYVAEEAGGYDHVPGIYSREQITAWKQITNAVHAKGGIILCQLWALGRFAYPGTVPIVWGPSTKPYIPKDYDTSDAASFGTVKVTVMTETDIARFVGHYRQAALNAIEAGFDGVEIHGANGFLLDQFLQTAYNDRTDAYGGSLENRFRFPLEVLNAVCSAIGPSRVGVRMSPFSRFQGMREVDPLAVFVPYTEAILREQPGLAYVHAVEGRAMGILITPDHLQSNKDTLDPIRKVVESAGGVRFLVAGGYSPETALNHAQTTDDIIVFGRQFLANPDLPARILNGWPLNKYDRTTFYTQGQKGYTDYPVYQASEEISNSL